jgi:hypothetical protein
MSSFLRKIVQTPPPEAIQEEIEFKDPETGEPAFVSMRGHNDADLIIKNLMTDDAQTTALALTYSAALKMKGIADADVSKGLIPFIRMVHSALVTPEGEEPLSEVDIAYLAKRHGSIFMKLVEAAGRISNVENIAEQFMDAQAGKSPSGSDQ